MKIPKNETFIDPRVKELVIKCPKCGPHTTHIYVNNVYQTHMSLPVCHSASKPTVTYIWIERCYLLPHTHWLNFIYCKIQIVKLYWSDSLKIESI